MVKINSHLLKLILLIIVLQTGCSKEEPEDIVDINNLDQGVYENVVPILSNKAQLVSNSSELAKGIYTIRFTDKPAEIAANDIIIGEEGEGFLRKVKSVSVSGNTLTMQTTQANLEDVFKIASLEFNTDITKSAESNNGISQEISVNHLANGVDLSANGFIYNFSNTVIYQKAPLTIKISSGEATFDPNFSFESDYGFPVGLSNLEFKTENAKLTIDCDVLVSASSEVSLPNYNTTLADFDRYILIPVSGIPVKLVVNTKLVAELTANISSNIDANIGFRNDYTITTGVKYYNNNWTGNFYIKPSFTLKPFSFGGEVNFSQNLTITPRVSFRLYGVVGPYCEPKMTEDFVYNIASPSLDWDSKLKAGLDLTTGVDLTIFGSNVADFSTTDNYNNTIWNAPDSIEIISGDDQSGTFGEQLADPLKVRVIDNLENPLSMVPVYFAVTEGGGIVDTTAIPTDENGYAEVYWTLGKEGNQVVNATVKKANGGQIGSTAYFGIKSNSHELMTIRVTNLLDECDNCDKPTISWNSEGTSHITLGFGESTEFQVKEPFLYIWTCNPNCIWTAYPVPQELNESIVTDEENPNHRKLKFTRVL